MELHRFLIDWMVLKPPEDTEGSVSYEGMELMECLDFFTERTLLARSDNEEPELPELPECLNYEHSVAFWLALKEHCLKV